MKDHSVRVVGKPYCGDSLLEDAAYIVRQLNKKIPSKEALHEFIELDERKTGGRHTATSSTRNSRLRIFNPSGGNGRDGVKCRERIAPLVKALLVSSS